MYLLHFKKKIVALPRCPPYDRLTCCVRSRSHNRTVVGLTDSQNYSGPFLGVACRSLTHRKLLDGSSGGKLAPLAISPDEQPTSTITTTVSSDSQNPPSVRRPSVTTLVYPPCLSFVFVPFRFTVFCSVVFVCRLFVCLHSRVCVPHDTQWKN